MYTCSDNSHRDIHTHTISDTSIHHISISGNRILSLLTLKRKTRSSNTAITCAVDSVCYSPTSVVLKQNLLHAAVKLLDASKNITEFVSDTKSILDNLQSTNKMVYSQLTTIVDHFELSIGFTLKDEIIPNVDLYGSPTYVL